MSLASVFVDRFPGGTTFGLVGTLGAGKTRLVQGIAEALRVDVSEVTSPTFTLLQSHSGLVGDTGEPRTLHHLDAYRIADEDEFFELGVEELFDDTDAWTIVEWADLVRDVMPVETVWIEMKLEAVDEWRTLEIRSSDATMNDSIELLRQACDERGWMR
ncbi:tRNA threonylcarbamoyladenosine biosynthesis protein TsaE [Planctomycetes bacterium CA13]|uniref:tRNA threonylcarbamoyladenosine biosynthesis protein TsaE n=1 Tax=Novipirellula herctigrandis TaxID=2527986 RepID=A0A5C5YWT3_9BACT|nr:tRNA threonylcarbamoyladenosine biosynthesis protein TsaE [Planctomycetes bacterium CA13]